MNDQLSMVTRADSKEQQASIRRFDSRELFLNAKTIEILHGGKIYRLQITRQDKLILTK